MTPIHGISIHEHTAAIMPSRMTIVYKRISFWRQNWQSDAPGTTLQCRWAPLIFVRRQDPPVVQFLVN